MEKFIEALDEIKDNNIKDESSLEIWRSKAINIVVRIYGKDSKQEEQIKSIKYRTYMVSIDAPLRNNSRDCNEQAAGLISGFISDIKRFGLPKKEIISNQGINITLNQSQQQNQSIKLNVILSALQDELNGKQLKEIQEIIDNNELAEEKKVSIINKITSFGSGLASNILANILTNPGLYS